MTSWPRLISPWAAARRVSNYPNPSEVLWGRRRPRIRLRQYFYRMYHLYIELMPPHALPQLQDTPGITRYDQLGLHR
jgi:hypothetical protein